MKKLIYRGFTLVELSIVLVVIGLLVGGLLLAQSIIGVSKVQTFASQISEADVAMANFKNT